jgi:D-alanyl-D-alanine carboxypeptidase
MKIPRLVLSRLVPAFVPFILCLSSCVKSAPVISPAPAEVPGKGAATGETLPDLAEAIARLSEADRIGKTVLADVSTDAPATQRSLLSEALDHAELPRELRDRLGKIVAEDPSFVMDLLSCLGTPTEPDPFLRLLVDKKHPLPEAYEPDDLVELSGGSYQAGRRGLMLRRPAAEALEEMAARAKADGVTLVASSAYRSYAYQVEVYNRIVGEIGQTEADRESARPGYSQHQTGLVVDFGSIDDSFAETRAGLWMAENAGSFGWSLSFPAGYEEATGYRWESWHYRYVGKDLAAFIDEWFDGVQQYALQFIYAWEAAAKSGLLLQ